MLCCIFNYAPKYRESIYKKIDESFDTQFVFGREVVEGKVSGIAKLDYNIFKHKPIENRNILLFKRVLWRTNLLALPFKKKYKSFLITADTPLSYVPFLIFCRLFGKKVYCWGHGFKDHFKRIKILEKLYRSSTDVFFTYGQSGKNRMCELGWPKENLEIIYNSLNEGVKPIENESLKSTIYKDHFNNDFPVLIFIGRLINSKRIDWLIQSVSDLRKKGLNLNLMIIGNGPECSKLVDKTNALSINNNIWFYGECYDEQVLKGLLYNADLCVSPGEVGLTALHTMSYGVPVISHDNFYKQGPEYELIVSNQTGLLYEYGNYDDMVEKIGDWFSCDHNRCQTREDCYSLVNSKWNSNYQLELLTKIIK